MPSDSIEQLVVEMAEQVRHRFYGKYRGIVQDTDDPEQMGRIRALVPEVLDAEVSPWALPCAPFTGDGLGQYTIPPVDAGVWIEFEAGDPARPIWTGGWWSRQQIPQSNSGTTATPAVKIIRSEQGLLLSLDDDSQTIDLSDANGDNLLHIEAPGGQILLKGAVKVVVEAPQIELVDSASHPIVFGDELMNYLTQLVTILQTHTHPGEMAAGVLPVTPMVPVPTFPMPTPSLISTKVRSG